MSKHQFLPDLPPPANTVGVIGWLRQHLFLQSSILLSP